MASQVSVVYECIWMYMYIYIWIYHVVLLFHTSDGVNQNYRNPHPNHKKPCQKQWFEILGLPKTLGSSQGCIKSADYQIWLRHVREGQEVQEHQDTLAEKRSWKTMLETQQSKEHVLLGMYL